MTRHVEIASRFTIKSCNTNAGKRTAGASLG